MATSAESDRNLAAQPIYAWRDHSRFVDICAVQTGWLVLWGKYEDAGARKLVFGQQIYREADGARRRLATAIVELTANPASARDALTLLERQGGLQGHQFRDLPEPL